MFIVRSEREADRSAIHAVHRACFATQAEAELVDALRAAGRLTVSLVAEYSGLVVGHIAFSPVTVGDGQTGLGLGPLAVLEAHRRHGVGARLVEEGLAACRAAGFGWVVVLGDSAYYGRFGFEPASIYGLHDEFRGGDAFQAIELAPGTLPAEAGLVKYASEFSAFS